LRRPKPENIPGRQCAFWQGAAEERVYGAVDLPKTAENRRGQRPGESPVWTRKLLLRYSAFKRKIQRNLATKHGV
jgi:hypothetical protein